MAEHSWPRAIDLLFDLVACELFGVVDEQTDDLCVVVAFVPKFEREVVVAPNLFRNRTELGEADAETGQPACAVAHFLPVRLPPRVAVLLEQVEDLGLGHGTSLLSIDQLGRDAPPVAPRWWAARLGEVGVGNHLGTRLQYSSYVGLKCCRSAGSSTRTTAK